MHRAAGRRGLVDESAYERDDAEPVRTPVEEVAEDPQPRAAAAPVGLLVEEAGLLQGGGQLGQVAVGVAGGEGGTHGHEGRASSPTRVWLKRERHGDVHDQGQALRARHVLPPRPRAGRGAVGRPARRPVPERVEGQPARRAGLGGRARSLPADRGPCLPVGAPLDHRARAARPRGRHLLGRTRPDPRRAQLDLRPRRGRPRPGARHRAPAGGLLRPRARLPARHHGAGDRRGRVGPGRDQRLPADHPRPLLRVARAPAARRPRPVARRPPRGDGVGDEARLHRGQQRRLPLRLRRVAGGVRGRVRPPVHGARLARGPARPTGAT